MNFITDRTSSDVLNKTSKGYYNVEDYERINEGIQYLAKGLGLSLTSLSFSLGEVITAEKFQTLVDNVAAIRAAWHVASDTPATPTILNWNYSKANDLEKILQDMTEFYDSYAQYKLYAGTFHAGTTSTLIRS